MCNIWLSKGGRTSLPDQKGNEDITIMKITQSKTFWRGLWLAAVAMGGIVLVKTAFEILNLTDKKYIDL